MTLEEIERLLPNGFHDAKISRFERDFERDTVTFVFDALIGMPSDPPDGRSAYRCAELIFHDTVLFTIEPPDPESAFRASGCVWISDKPNPVPANLRQMLDPSLLTYSIFVLDWHANINIAAQEISFRWLAPLPAAIN